jgi:hypothetical protein
MHLATLTTLLTFASCAPINFDKLLKTAQQKFNSATSAELKSLARIEIAELNEDMRLSNWKRKDVTGTLTVADGGGNHGIVHGRENSHLVDLMQDLGIYPASKRRKLSHHDPSDFKVSVPSKPDASDFDQLLKSSLP